MSSNGNKYSFPEDLFSDEISLNSYEEKNNISIFNPNFFISEKKTDNIQENLNIINNITEDIIFKNNNNNNCIDNKSNNNNRNSNDNEILINNEKKIREHQKIETSKKNFVPNSHPKKIKFLAMKTLGRNKKNSNKLSAHNANSSDNIKKRIKVMLYKYTLKFLNSKFVHPQIYDNLKGQVLQKISKKEINKIQNEKIKEWLDKSLREIFSITLCNRYKNFKVEHNIETIEDVFIRGDEIELIRFLEMKMRVFFEVFVNNFENPELEGFERINDAIKELKKEGKNEEYLNKFKKTCLMFLKY